MKPTQKFYKMPQALFSDKYSQLSNDAKILYMLLLDRKSLSEKNHFNDENGNTVVLYSNDEVCRKIGCGHDKTPLSCIQMMKCVEKSVAVTIRRPNCFESWKAQIYCEGTDKVKANRV